MSELCLKRDFSSLMPLNTCYLSTSKIKRKPRELPPIKTTKCHSLKKMKMNNMLVAPNKRDVLYHSCSLDINEVATVCLGEEDRAKPIRLRKKKKEKTRRRYGNWLRELINHVCKLKMQDSGLFKPDCRSRNQDSINNTIKRLEGSLTKCSSPIDKETNLQKEFDLVYGSFNKNNLAPQSPTEIINDLTDFIHEFKKVKRNTYNMIYSHMTTQPVFGEIILRVSLDFLPSDGCDFESSEYLKWIKQSTRMKMSTRKDLEHPEVIKTLRTTTEKMHRSICPIRAKFLEENSTPESMKTNKGCQPDSNPMEATDEDKEEYEQEKVEELNDRDSERVTGEKEAIPLSLGEREHVKEEEIEKKNDMLVEEGVGRCKKDAWKVLGREEVWKKEGQKAISVLDNIKQENSSEEKNKNRLQWFPPVIPPFISEGISMDTLKCLHQSINIELQQTRKKIEESISRYNILHSCNDLVLKLQWQQEQDPFKP